MKTKVLLIILALFSTLTFAQRKVADKFFKNFAYVKATELYKEAIKKGNDSEHVLTRLGIVIISILNLKQLQNGMEKL